MTTSDKPDYALHLAINLLADGVCVVPEDRIDQFRGAIRCTCDMERQWAELQHEKADAKLRRLLAQVYSGVNLYTDDGELQDGSRFPPIDFLRDSVDDIESKIKYRSEHDHE